MSTFSLCLLCAGAWISQAPDRDAQPGEWGYHPRTAEVVRLNPPAFSWVHEPKAKSYTVQWSTRPDFGDVVTVENIPWCVYTHNRPLQAGTYSWRYRVLRADGKPSPWSRARTFTIPENATKFPRPTLAELTERVPTRHPRLFIRADQLDSWRTWVKGEGKPAFTELVKRADQLLRAEPTPEPQIRGSIRDPQTRNSWWSNRTVTEKVCMEAETLALVYLLSGEPRYGEAARRWILHLASWDPDGPTNFSLNCEAAKPMLYRLPRAYDWAHAALSEADRAKVRQVMQRRAADAWKSGEIREGNGHLTQPYNSHGNRIWHKIGECGIAFLGEIPEASTWLDYAVAKFFAAYPVWSDDDGGWHEGLAYFAGYLTKIVGWLELARSTLEIDGLRKPFFANIANYPLTTAPPGSPNIGFGDLSYRSAQGNWTFLHYFARRNANPVLEWWARSNGSKFATDDPMMKLLFARLPRIEPRPPDGIPASRVFHGIGVAILNSTLLHARDDVQLRFKSSPFGRQSHGHDPHNAFTLNAYGEPLLVNCVYRDWHGSPFHTKYCWNSASHNTLLVDGQAQKVHSADPFGAIVAEDLQPAADYIAGEAARAYGDKLARYRRHVIFVKPDLFVIVDDIEANKPAAFQWRFHGLAEFQLDPAHQAFRLERPKARLLVNTIAPQTLTFKQTDGFDPAPDAAYLRGIGNATGYSNHWHVEAAAPTLAREMLMVTVLRPTRAEAKPPREDIGVDQNATAISLRIPLADGSTARVIFRKPGAATAKLGDVSFTHQARVDVRGTTVLLGPPEKR